MKAAIAAQTLGNSEALRVLANQRVYFAYQSVDVNIVHGVETQDVSSWPLRSWPRACSFRILYPSPFDSLSPSRPAR